MCVLLLGICSLCVHVYSSLFLHCCFQLFLYGVFLDWLFRLLCLYVGLYCFL